MLALGVGRPGDLDIVVNEPDLSELVSALAVLGILASVASLARTRQCRLDSFWGPLDVFVGSAPASQPLRLAGMTLRVAA